MRLALASIRCEKGDLDGNLARHVEVLEQARHDGCDLAVFPEMSLTGSVDPRVRPDHLVGVDDAAVGELIDQARRRHVAVLFGVAESAPGGPFITQAYAHHGAIRGIQRKRHLGKDEEGYLTGRETLRAELGAVRFGSVICAEGSEPWPWDRSSAGASLVCFSSAPGPLRSPDDRGQLAVGVRVVGRARAGPGQGARGSLGRVGRHGHPGRLDDRRGLPRHRCPGGAVG